MDTSPKLLSLDRGMRISRGRVSMDTSPKLLPLDRGMRISRIVTANTTSFDAMMKLGRATSRVEIMKICLFRHKRTCVLREIQRLPVGLGSDHMGWRHRYGQGSHTHRNTGSQQSILWAIDSKLAGSFEVELGSWLLSSVSGKDENHLSTLFTRTICRVHPDAQAVSLVRPGFACMEARYSPGVVMWTVTFIELQLCDELGGLVRSVVKSEIVA